MDYTFQKCPCHEIFVSIVWSVVCGAARSLIDGLYGPLNDGNMSSFCKYILTHRPDVLSQSIKSLSPWNRYMLNPLALYMLVTVFNSLMFSSPLFEMQSSDVRKVILDDFVWGKGIPFIF